MSNRVAVNRVALNRVENRVAENRVAVGLFLGLVLAPPSAHAQQGGPADLAYRIDRLERQIRQMTGDIEQLQYRNRELEALLNELRYADPRGAPRVAASPSYPPAPAAPAPAPGPAPGPAPASGAPPVAAPLAAPPAPAAPPGSRRRSDAFDPDANPYAPGAPRMLGSTPPQPPPPATRPGLSPTPYATGAEGDYPGSAAPVDGNYYARPPAAPPLGNAAVSPPPSAPGSAQEIYDAGVSSLQRRDYAAAEDAFRDFLRRYPRDRRAGEAQFNLGESLFQRQSYQDAADAFVALSKKYENSAKAPDALLRLGQSLVALNERELACVAFGDIGRKYPRAQPSVKQAVDREQKRARC